ncbi:hypothetical protein GTV32_15160 [Gordonia sp. SID5947]|uniref:VOC family protein n=1 Tax=Gordonia sp. SID5947 TaxID=2690315 RepID=UPI0013683040|nr:VOC family protein [Gordonia sp. SID5947]MYR07559.1 hypothetical protein [Gordonia sp. SID5947]
MTTEAPHSPIVPGPPYWIDLVTPDLEQSKLFYRTLFGWVYTDEGHESIAMLDGRPVCGLWPDSGKLAAGLSYWHTYLQVHDIHTTLERLSETREAVLWGQVTTEEPRWWPRSKTRPAPHSASGNLGLSGVY